MLSKIKKYFFSGVFCLLYISFVVQFAWAVVHVFRFSFDSITFGLGFLAIEWLALMAARFLSKKSSNSLNRHDNNHYRR
ncbi:MAG: hypothetical protein LBD94_03435 [Rickettsiales bacterium]|jgi:hypothetical protein|nr:hypothetical protein [Rickettsiales bacterium]